VWLALACTLVNFVRGGALVLKGKGDASCGFCRPPYEHAKVYKTLLLHKFSPLHALLTLQVRGNSKLSTAVLFVFNMLRTNGPEKTPRTKKQLVHTQESIATSFPLKFENYAHLHASYFLHCKNPTFFTARKAPLPGFFVCIFSSITCLKKPVLRPDRPRAQISNHGRTCTQALLLYRNGCLYKFYLHKMHGPTKHKTNVQASHKTKEH
jgi:hypothetical protein